jgi:hypothetical protein
MILVRRRIIAGAGALWLAAVGSATAARPSGQNANSRVDDPAAVF